MQSSAAVIAGTERSRFLALGDSYTIGEGVPRAACWPVQLAQLLRAGGLPVDDPAIVAKTGWTTGELAAAMDGIAFHPPYALVTLLIGVNDQYRGGAPASYRREFGDLLRRAVELAGGVRAHVVAVSIPDWGVTPFTRTQKRDPARVGAAIDAFNAAAQVVVAAAGCRWVDVTRVSRAPEARLDLASDGLHPSARQYARWAALVLPVARAALSVA